MTVHFTPELNSRASSSKNVSRLRFVSYDPEAYFNHKAVPFIKYEEPEKPKFTTLNSYATKNEQEEKIERLIVTIEKKKVDITTS